MVRLKTRTDTRHAQTQTHDTQTLRYTHVRFIIQTHIYVCAHVHKHTNT